MILPAPGVEHELDAGKTVISMRQEGGAEIARPGIVQRHFDHVDPAAGRQPCFRRVGRPRRQSNRLKPRDRARDARIGLLGAQSAVRPAEAFMARGPTHPGTLMPSPFGGPGETVLQRRRRRGIEPSVHASYPIKGTA